jgi:hypothetical protein
MPNNIVKSFADKTDKSEAEVEKLWVKAKGIVSKGYDDVESESDQYYALVTGVLKKMLKIDENRFDELYEKAVHKDQVDKAGKLDNVDADLAKVIVVAGRDDGDKNDDKIEVKKSSWKASVLKPSQSTMVLDKSIGMALNMLRSNNVGGDLGAIVSNDNHIMDGHHRWSATVIAVGSGGEVGGYAADLKGEKLQPLLNLLTKGEFGIGRGKKGSGSIKDYTAKNVKKALERMVSSGIEGEFPWTPEQVAEVLEGSFGSVEDGIKTMSNNVKQLNTKVPKWAPSRDQMPVIEPSQVPAAAKKLSRGEVDHKAPFKESKFDSLYEQVFSEAKGPGTASQVAGKIKKELEKVGIKKTYKDTSGNNAYSKQSQISLSIQNKKALPKLKKILLALGFKEDGERNASGGVRVDMSIPDTGIRTHIPKDGTEVKHIMVIGPKKAKQSNLPYYD